MRASGFMHLKVTLKVPSIIGTNPISHHVSSVVIRDVLWDKIMRKFKKCFTSATGILLFALVSRMSFG